MNDALKQTITLEALSLTNNVSDKLLQFNEYFNEDCDNALIILESLEKLIAQYLINQDIESILKFKDVLEEELADQDVLPNKSYLLGRAHSIINFINMYSHAQHIESIPNNLAEIDRSILIRLDRNLETAPHSMTGLLEATPEAIHESISKLKMIGLVYPQRMGKSEFLYLSSLGKKVLNELQTGALNDQQVCALEARSEAKSASKPHFSFPPPLSQEQEDAWIQLLKQGNEKAKNILIERNLHIVAHVVKNFESVCEDQDDLISIGTIGLIKAINAFDSQKGTKLATFAAKCVENEILMHMRVMKKVRSKVYLYEPIGVDKEGNKITLIDILGTHAEVVSETGKNSFDKSQLLEKMQLLSKREKKVVEGWRSLHATDKQTILNKWVTLCKNRILIQGVSTSAKTSLLRQASAEIKRAK